jgi:hypothetical protein
MSGNARGISCMIQYERRVLTRQYCTFFALSRALSQSPGSRLIEQNVTCTSIGSRGQQPLCFDSVLISDIRRVLSVKLLVKPATLLQSLEVRVR